MTNPVKGLNPLKKVTWTLWNLDADGNITNWLATLTAKSTNEVLSDTDGEWITASADVEAMDNVWSGHIVHGIAMRSSAGKPYLLYVPNVRNAFVKE